MSNQDISYAGEIITEQLNAGSYAHLTSEELVQIIVKEFAGLLIEFNEPTYNPDSLSPPEGYEDIPW